MKLPEDKINYIFHDKKLLETALTHSSYVKNGSGKISAGEYNERLEFLGDAFFDAIIGEKLFREFPDREEGFLSRTRASIVCESSLAARARSIDLGDYILLGRGEEKTGGRSRESILADAMEAVIGAIFLDGGYEEARRVVLELFSEELADAKKGRYHKTDFKTTLQEWLQGKGITSIKYSLENETGPDHDKTFYVSLYVKDKQIALGSGKSKKQAEQCAAESALRSYNVI